MGTGEVLGLCLSCGGVVGRLRSESERVGLGGVNVCVVASLESLCKWQVLDIYIMLG